MNISMIDSVEAIAERLKIFRVTMLGEEQSAATICRETGITEPQWSMWEKGDRPISLDGASRLVKRYGLTLDWIYLGDEQGLPMRYAKHIAHAAE